MTTAELVSHICRMNSDWEVVSVLMYLDEIQRRMLAHPLKSREIIDPLTGVHPTLTIQSGVFSYTLGVLNGFAANAVLADKVYSGNTEYDVSFIPSIGGVPAKINVGNRVPVGTVCSVRAYKMPVKLTSTNIPLEIPDNYHFTTVMVGVQGLLELGEYGSSEKMALFERRLLPSFWGDMNWNDEPVAGETESYRHGE